MPDQAQRGGPAAGYNEEDVVDTRRADDSREDWHVRFYPG